jgi:hypothetical protein
MTRPITMTHTPDQAATIGADMRAFATTAVVARSRRAGDALCHFNLQRLRARWVIMGVSSGDRFGTPASEDVREYTCWVFAKDPGLAPQAKGEWTLGRDGLWWARK